MGYRVPLGNQGWKTNKTPSTESSPRAGAEAISVAEKIKQHWNEIIQLIPSPFFVSVEGALLSQLEF